MSIVVFWIDKGAGGSAYDVFSDASLVDALKFVEVLRRTPNICHVCISSEFSDMVGKPGVDTISDDCKLPNGQDYEWSKQYRGAGPYKE